MITTSIYINKTKGYCGFCSSHLQNDISLIFRNAETIMISNNLPKEIFRGLSLLINHLTFCMKILNTKTFLFSINAVIGPLPKQHIPFKGKLRRY